MKEANLNSAIPPPVLPEPAEHEWKAAVADEPWARQALRDGQPGRVQREKNVPHSKESFVGELVGIGQTQRRMENMLFDLVVSHRNMLAEMNHLRQDVHSMAHNIPGVGEVVVPGRKRETSGRHLNHSQKENGSNSWEGALARRASQRKRSFHVGLKVNPADLEDELQTEDHVDYDTMDTIMGPKASTMSSVERVWRQVSKSKFQDANAAIEGANGFVAATLPLDWPSVLPMRDDLQDFEVERSTQLYGSSPLQKKDRSFSRNQPVLQDNRLDVNVHAQDGCLKWFVIDPDASIRILFDMCGLIFLLYDLVAIPYMLAWDTVVFGAMQYMAFAGATFWTLDLLLNFVTSYSPESSERMVLERRLSKIAKRYLRAWFLPDFLLVACDWCTLIVVQVLQDASDESKTQLRLTPVLRIAKAGRLLRIMSVFRAMKFARKFEEFVDHRLSEWARLSIRFLSIIVFAIWFNHMVACVWYFLGSYAPTDTGARWTDGVTVVGDSAIPFLDQNLWYQYMTAFHWSVSQITLGAIDIYCSTTIERAFNIITLMGGLVFGSTLISSLSATMVELQMLKREQTLKMRALRRYLRENAVGRRICTLVLHQVSQRMRHRDRLSDKDVPVLALLSFGVQQELRLEMFRRFLVTHPLFRVLGSIDLDVLRKLCTGSVDFHFTRTQDELFLAGTAATSAYFLCEGSLEYIQVPGSAPVIEETRQFVEAGLWMCEAALWGAWIHTGSAVATKESQIMVVQMKGLGEAVARTPEVARVTAEYCKHFHRRLQHAKPPSAPWPTDLQVPFTDYDDLVVSMDTDVQVMIGLAALDQMAASTWDRKRNERFEALRAEVDKGKCTVMVNSQGEIQRVTSIVVLKITRDGGDQFVQIGKKEDGRITPGCTLPGGKRERGELTDETINRLLESKLQPLANCVEVSGIEREVEWKDSPEYGVRTKYLRTICCTRIMGNWNAVRINVIPSSARVSIIEEGTRSMEPALSGTSRRSRVSDGSPYAKGQSSGAMPDWIPSISAERQVVNPVSSDRRFSHVMSDAVMSKMMSMRRSTSGSGGGLENTEGQHLYKREVYCIEDTKGNTIYYTWLSEAEFEKLRSKASESVLAGWLNTLEDSMQRNRSDTSPTRRETPTMMLPQ